MGGVSKAGYYKWLARPKRKLNEIDLKIKDVFEANHEKVGYRQIQMILRRKYSIIANHKKIRRSMRIQGLYCKIRRKKTNFSNQYSSSLERAFPNLIRQNFNIKEADTVYSGDITEARLKTSTKIYMHMVKDVATKEIVSYSVSTSPNTALVLNSFCNHLLTLPKNKIKKLIYHTDQGGVFMSDRHIEEMKKLGVKQSMSRRGNCLDNAPIESFFGHMKDYVDFNNMKSKLEVEKAVKEYVDYYNNERPQWGIKKMTPAEYRSHLK